MRTPIAISKESTAELFTLMNQVKSLAEFKRIQCVWLRASLHLIPEEIAQAVGLKSTTVKQIQSRYLREGPQAFYGSGRGGRRNQNLTLEEERKFISS